MRPALVLALALGLTACGGKAMFTVGGSIAVEGEKHSGVVLSTNGMDLAVPADARTFEFANQIAYGDVYDIKVTTPPAHQTCVVSRGSDTAGRVASINAAITCALKRSTVGGTITGLPDKATLTLANGSTGGTVTVTQDAATPGKATFTFVAPVAYGTSYGVTIWMGPMLDGKPAPYTCQVGANGTGVMGETAVSDIAVTCAPT
jgi:hypothetical protein